MLGNLLSRADANESLSETFGYDSLNRLTSTTVGVSLSKVFSYDPLGNLLSKSDVGNYVYPAAGQALPHAVMSISGSTLNTTFTYDPNGNQTAGSAAASPTPHLGSIAVITDETGAVAERLSYDAWGKHRFPNGADDPSGSITSQTTVGFTGQEELADVGLVHLNGRVYDPVIGRMMSADPFVPDPTNGQAWNRFSYVINNPLAFTDPNGYSGCGDSASN